MVSGRALRSHPEMNRSRKWNRSWGRLIDSECVTKDWRIEAGLTLDLCSLSFFFFFLLYLTGAICVCRLRSISILFELWENTSVSWAELWLTFMFRKLEDGKFVPTMWRQCSLNWLWGADVWSLIKKILRTQNALCCNSDLSASSLRALFSSFMS